MGLFDYISDKVNGTGNQLVNEKNKAMLGGNDDAISALKKMDREIGKLMKPFNGVARVPEPVVKQIEQLIKENSQAMTMVNATKAYTEDRTERLGNLLRNDGGTKEVPVKWLEYVNNFTSPTGGPIEQRVAQFKVGM